MTKFFRWLLDFFIIRKKRRVISEYCNLCDKKLRKEFETTLIEIHCFDGKQQLIVCEECATLMNVIAKKSKTLKTNKS